MKWLHRPEDAHKLIAAISLGIVLVALGSFFGHRAGSTQKPSIACPDGWVCFDPRKTSCLVFDYTVAGWQPVQAEKRGFISLLVNQGRAEYNFAHNAIDCYARDPNSINLGEHVATLPSEFWKWKRSK